MKNGNEMPVLRIGLIPSWILKLIRGVVVWTLSEERKKERNWRAEKHLNGLIFKFCGEAKTRLNLISTSLFDCTGRATSPSDRIRE